MDIDNTEELQNIIRRVGIKGPKNNCTKTRNYLCASFSTSTTVKRDFESKSGAKERQANCLTDFVYINDTNEKSPISFSKPYRTLSKNAKLLPRHIKRNLPAIHNFLMRNRPAVNRLAV